jgi:integrase
MIGFPGSSPFIRISAPCQLCPAWHWPQALEDYKIYPWSADYPSARWKLTSVTLAKLRDFALARPPLLHPTNCRSKTCRPSSIRPPKLRPAATSQARLVSAVRSFHRSLLLEKQIEEDPTDLLESPRMGRHLPVFLSVQEIDAMAAAIDMSLPLAHRDRAMLEVLYGCGLRVSELCGLRISRLHFQDGYIRVVGKGDKERLVPIGPGTMAHVERYRRRSACICPCPRRRKTCCSSTRAAAASAACGCSKW